MVERYCGLAGSSFRAVFADLEQRFDFAREPSDRWPDPPTMRRAADWLRARRDELLVARRALIAVRRQAKASGRRATIPPELARAEQHMRAYAAAFPRVGCWGWRRRRQHQ